MGKMYYRVWSTAVLRRKYSAMQLNLHMVCLKVLKARFSPWGDLRKKSERIEHEIKTHHPFRN